MEILFKTKKLEKICTKFQAAQREYGEEMASLIHQRIKEIRAVDSAETMVKCRIGRCHPLKGNRKNEYAVDLVHPRRLIFTQEGNEIKIARIEEIVDYH
jgi:proteic killer suppression protein